MFHLPWSTASALEATQVTNCAGCQWRHRRVGRVGRIGFGQPLRWCQWGHQSPAHNKDSSCCMGQCLCFGISCYFNPWPPALTGVFYRDTCKWKKVTSSSKASGSLANHEASLVCFKLMCCSPPWTLDLQARMLSISVYSAGWNTTTPVEWQYRWVSQRPNRKRRSRPSLA